MGERAEVWEEEKKGWQIRQPFFVVEFKGFLGLI